MCKAWFKFVRGNAQLHAPFTGLRAHGPCIPPEELKQFKKTGTFPEGWESFVPQAPAAGPAQDAPTVPTSSSVVENILAEVLAAVAAAAPPQLQEVPSQEHEPTAFPAPAAAAPPQVQEVPSQEHEPTAFPTPAVEVVPEVGAAIGAADAAINPGAGHAPAAPAETEMLQGDAVGPHPALEPPPILGSSYSKDAKLVLVRQALRVVGDLLRGGQDNPETLEEAFKRFLRTAAQPVSNKTGVIHSEQHRAEIKTEFHKKPLEALKILTECSSGTTSIVQGDIPSIKERFRPEPVASPLGPVVSPSQWDDVVTAKEITAVILGSKQSFARGGELGISREALVEILMVKECPLPEVIRDMEDLIKAYLSGTLPTELMDLLNTSSLVKIPKADGSPRYIAVEEQIRWLATKLVARKYTPDIIKANFEDSKQLDFSSASNGCALSATAVQIVLEAGGSAIGLDLKNAFGNASARCLMTKAQDDPVLYRALQSILGVQRLRMPLQDGSTEHIQTDSLPQGSSLSPLALSCAVTEATREFREQGHVVLSYMDDITLMSFGLAQGVESVEVLKHLLQASGLPINPTKSWSMSGSTVSTEMWHHLEETNNPLTNNVTLLGCSVGISMEDRIPGALKAVDGIIADLSKVESYLDAHIDNPLAHSHHAVLHMLSHSFIPKIASLTEWTDSRVLQNLLDPFYVRFAKMWKKTMGFEEELPEHAWIRAGLPYANGGLAFTDYRGLRGWSHRLATLVQVFDQARALAQRARAMAPEFQIQTGPVLEELDFLCGKLREAVEAVPNPTGSLAEAVHALSEIRDINNEGLMGNRKMADVKHAKSLSKTIKQVAVEQALVQTREALGGGAFMDELHASRITGQGTKWAAMLATRNQPLWLFNNQELEVTLLRDFFLMDLAPVKCSQCNLIMDPQGEHATRCRNTRVSTKGGCHQYLKLGVAQAIKDLGEREGSAIYVGMEPQVTMGNVNPQKRADLKFQSPLGQGICVDLTVASMEQPPAAFVPSQEGSEAGATYNVARLLRAKTDAYNIPNINKALSIVFAVYDTYGNTNAGSDRMFTKVFNSAVPLHDRKRSFKLAYFRQHLSFVARQAVAWQILEYSSVGLRTHTAASQAVLALGAGGQ